MKRSDLVDLTKEISSLKYKISQLKEEMDKEIRKITSKYETQIKKYETALEVFREMNEVCEYCEGRKGSTMASAAGHNDGEWVPCSVCKGTGLAHPVGNETKREVFKSLQI
jgi:hypothetical protein